MLALRSRNPGTITPELLKGGILRGKHKRPKPRKAFVYVKCLDRDLNSDGRQAEGF